VADPAVIKKYRNRRLYDAEQSRHLTIAELAQKVRGGRDVRVVDAATGADLTQATLTQVIVEERDAARLLPVPLLQALIRMDDDALAEFFGYYLAWALETYNRMRRVVRATAEANPVAKALGGLDPVAAWQQLFGSPSAWGAPPPPPPVTPSSAEPSPSPRATAAAGDEEGERDQEVERLRQEVDALKAAMRELLDR
jgi:polyhydroxyalkanoate synthesis repressor PhaR